MRLHHLSVTAFGPFAGTETLDFDTLNDAGLFLLTGPTGGGKSSILDAVCFALYGQIPGVRDVKELKSQHAPDAVAPEVVLEFSIGDRRFEVRRRPEWARPKKRSDGVARQHASATLTRISHDDRTLVSSRIQEVGHEIADLLGMTLEQFEQVVLLPQGEFQTFLRASSQERHDVLQQLFKTHRFAHIEQWVQAHSRELKVQAETSAAAVRRIVDSIADRIGTCPPQPLEPLECLAWADEVIHALDTDLVADRRTAEQAQRRESLARSAHQDAVRTVAARERVEAATLVLAELDDEAEAARTATTALAADARASRCLPVLAVLDDAHTTRSLRGDEHLEALKCLEPSDATDLPSADERLREKLAALRAALPRLLAHDEAREAETLARAGVTHCADVLRELEATTTRMPSAVRQLREELARVEALAATRDAAATTVEIALSRLDAARRLPPLEGALADAHRAHLDARELAATTREALHDTIDRRLAGIAAELAGRLTDGEPCQVCGSPDHPAVALPCDGAVDQVQQAAAAQTYDAARAHLDGVAELLRTAQSHTDTTRHAAGGLDVAAAADQLDKARKRLEEAELAQARRTATLDALVALEEEREDAVAQQSTLAVRVAELTEAAEGHARAALAAARDLSAAWGSELPPASWSDHVNTLELRHHAVAAARATCDASRQAESAAAELEDRARSTILLEGFATLDEARGAALGDDRRASLSGLLESRHDAETSARAVIAEVEVAANLHEPLPDVASAAQRLSEAGRIATTSAAQVLTLEQTLKTVSAARTRLEHAIADWRPAQIEAERAESVAELVRGTGPHNQLQMRLSSYVLATRLDQVVAAANERLAHMRDHRYLLRRTGRAARRNSQAGLGLEVVDQWTGSSRDPRSLSGGETFVVSLALALGLADVVSDEAGGVDVATLFVDEGFGSLDADTLDDVMDRLDGLRAGGRTVGVVSHVGELRNRIPTQVHVEKRRDGSSVRVRTLAG